MCQSYQVACACGRRTAEIFFGRMVLDESAVKGVYCPHCSEGVDVNRDDRAWDNGWILELHMAVVRDRAPIMETSAERIDADWVFDRGFVTWVGITPDEAENRNRERTEILKLAATDFPGYLKAMKEWGIGREKRFSDEGWRKMKA